MFRVIYTSVAPTPTQARIMQWVFGSHPVSVHVDSLHALFIAPVHCIIGTHLFQCFDPSSVRVADVRSHRRAGVEATGAVPWRQRKLCRWLNKNVVRSQ